MQLTILTQNAPLDIQDFPPGALFLVDKPLGWTSFDVVAKIRWHLSKRLKTKKLKIGHAGTLDPLADGLLLLCTGAYTKKIESLQGLEKEYTGTFVFGATTPSLDLEKAPDNFFPVEHLTDDLLAQTRGQFLGEIQQLPPMFSAVKVDGKRLYQNARTGETVELELRPVRIDTFETGPLRPVPDLPERAEVRQLKGKIFQHPDFAGGLQVDFRVVCGKGTYIRSLAHDFGAALGSGAYLSRLRRTRTGGFSVENAWQVADLVAWIQAN